MLRRDAEDFAGVDDDFFAVDPELERAFENVGELLVVVAVLGDDAAFLQQHASQHDFLADDELALQERVKVFERDGAPGDVLRGRESARLARDFAGLDLGRDFDFDFVFAMEN